MKKIIKNNLNLIIITIVLLQPILDLITGITLNLYNVNISIGIIIKTIFMIFLVSVSTLIYKNKKTPYILIGIYIIFYLLGLYIYKSNNIFLELQGLIRTFYFPIILITLFQLKENLKISTMSLMTMLITYIVLIFITSTLNLGNGSYEIAKVGSVGLFISANEISAIISILTPIIFCYLTEKKYIFKLSPLILLYTYTILSIGTKTPLLSLIITIIAVVIWILIKKRNYVVKMISTIIISLILIINIMPKTSFYKNIEIHLNYLKIDQISEIFRSKETIDHFIFSQRLTFLEDKNEKYANSSLYEKLFGIGYIDNDTETKLIEMDYFDIFYSHGILGFILYYTIIIYIFIKLFKNKKQINFDQYMIYTAITISLLLAFFTGHIHTSPSVSILLALLMILIYKKHKKECLFTANDLNIGGIENSLINLTNNLNNDKYKTTIILEKKEGELLSKLHKNINVKEVKVYNNKNKYIRKIKNYLRKTIYQIYNYNTYDFSCCYTTYSYSANKLALVSSKNNSIYIHSNYNLVYSKEEFYQFFDSRNITKFNKILFVSTESKKDFLEKYPILQKKCLVFNNFINIEEVNRLSDEKINYSKNQKNIVFVGRLDDSSKKLKRAINLIDKLDGYNLMIVGDGPDKNMYKKEVVKLKLEKKVFFLGKKTNPYPYIKNAKALILTSDYEGFPVTFLEAIALNTKIITTINVTDDQLDIGKDFGLLINKDPKNMLKEIINYLENTSKNRELDLNKIQVNRMKELEKIFDEVK